MEKDIKVKSKEEISLQKKLNERAVEISSLKQDIAEAKSEMKNITERLELEMEKSVGLIKKINSADKTIFTRESEFKELLDQKLMLESELKTLQLVVDEHKKDNQLLSDANFKIKSLQEEKSDLMKEIRKVSELQKKIKLLEAEKKIFSNIIKKKDISKHASHNVDVIDPTDPMEIDLILKRIGSYPTQYAKTAAFDVPVNKMRSDNCAVVEEKNEVVEDIESLYTAASTSPKLEIEESSAYADESEVRNHNLLSNNKQKEFPVKQLADTATVFDSPAIKVKNSSETSTADDIVVISSKGYKLSRKKEQLSDSDD